MNDHSDNTPHTHAPRPPLLVTIPQAAQLLAVGRSTVYQLIWDHELEPIRIGRSVRVTREAVQRFIDRHSAR